MQKLLLIVLPLLLIVGCEKNGLHIEYYKNGKKKSEGIYKNGKKDGLWSYWYKNGKKTAKRIRGGEYGNFYFPPTSNMYEVEYMAGEYELEDNPRIDPEAKCWDEDGNECICADYWYGCGKDSPYSKYIGNRNGHWEGYILGKYCNGSAKLTIRENGYVRLVMLTELCSYGKTVHTGYINPYNMKFVITSGDSKREGAIVDIKKGFKIVLIYTGINIDVYF